MKDIAERASVSVATVSRVLSGDTTLSVGASTRQRIFAAAEALNYTKHKRRQSQSRGTVALMLWYTEAQEDGDLYYRSIRWGVENDLARLGYQLTRVFPGEALPANHDITGIIAVGKYSDEQLESIRHHSVPLVVVDQDVLAAGITCVVPDFATAVKQVAQRFIGAGHQLMGMIAGQEQTTDHVTLHDPRPDLFVRAVTDGSRAQPLVATGEFSTESGYATMRALLQSTPRAQVPTAFFVANDTMAIGAIKALQEADLEVPGDVTVVGFDDLAIGRYLTPALSTVHVATQEMGRIGVQALHSLIGDQIQTPTRTTLASTLVNRQS